MVITTTTVLLVLCHALIEGLGGTVWRSQAVVFRGLHGLPAAPVHRATHQNTIDRALVALIPPDPVSAEPQSLKPISEIVAAFFRCNDPQERAQLARSVETAASGDIEVVAEEVRRVQLWPIIPDRGTFAFGSSGSGAVQVAYRLPDGYDASRPHPLLLCMPGERISPSETLSMAAKTLGALVRNFVLIAPARPINGAFHQPLAAAADLRRLVRAVRRRIHTDTDRTFLFGKDGGGDAAWLAAITHPDLFAGAIFLSSYPRVPYPPQALTLLLANLKPLRVLSVWSAVDGASPTGREELVAAYNRGIVRFAKQTGLPIAGVELATPSSTPLQPPLEAVAEVLSHHRPPPAAEVALWFRYPAHGHLEWLRLGEFMGDVWEEQQLAILPATGSDHDRFITDVFKSKLARLSGQIDGQSITIEARRCARVDLMLPYGVFDGSLPITVRCNGQRRHNRPVRQSIPVLLESAYEEWEFQRLVVSRISFSIKGKR